MYEARTHGSVRRTRAQLITGPLPYSIISPGGISGFCFPPDLRALRPLDSDGPAPIQLEGSESRRRGGVPFTRVGSRVEVSRRPPGDFGSGFPRRFLKLASCATRSITPGRSWRLRRIGCAVTSHARYLEHHARLKLAFTPVWMCRNESVALFGKLHREGLVLVVERLGVPQGIFGRGSSEC